MSVEDKERLEQELKARVLQNMRGAEDLAEFFTETLRNFSYRYIESETSSPAKPEWRDEKTLIIEVEESSLAQALKTDNSTTRTGLIELAKSFSKKDKPFVQYQMGVILKDVNSQGGGSFTLFAQTHWDFPEFTNKDKRNRKELGLVYEDALDLRNNFARHLEEVCVVL